MEKKRMIILIVAAAGMLGTFLPWASAFGMTVSGTAGDGWITFFLFAVGGAIAFFKGDKGEPIEKKMMPVIWGAAALAFIIAFLKVTKGVPSGVSLGFGLWLIVIAGLAQVAVCFFFKGSAGWDLPGSLADVKKAAGLPAAAPAAPAPEAKPAAPAEPAPEVEAAPAPETAPESAVEEPKEGE